MDREELVNTLNRIEHNLPVYSWTYEDIQFWPILKRDIFFGMHAIIMQKNKTKESYFDKFIRRSSKLFQSIFYNISFFLKKQSYKEVLYFGSDMHRINYKNQRINRYFYPLNYKNSYNIEYGGLKSNTIYPADFFDFDKASFIYLIIYRFFKKGNFELVKNKNHILDLINFFPDEFREPIKSIIERVNLSILEVKAYSKITESIFLKFKPKLVLGLCYYKPQMFAVHYMANKMGIKNYDIQHGAQGKLHVMYSFENFPEKGYNVLPEYFWLWDIPSEKNMKKWITKNRFHKSVVKGNPWINFIKNIESKELLSDKKIVIYTLQQGYLDDYMLNTISHTNNKYEWWLRFHPGIKDSFQNVKLQLESLSLLHKVNLKDANELPLPLILKNAFIHISKYSGSIIEAELMGIKSIIVENIGIKTFSDYIEWGNCIGIENPNSQKIIQAIENEQNR